MCQLEARMLPEKAQQLAMFDSGLLQVFFCKCHQGQQFRGLWVVPEDNSVPSLWSLAASAVKKAGSIPPDCLPTNLEKEAKEEEHNRSCSVLRRSHRTGEGTRKDNDECVESRKSEKSDKRKRSRKRESKRKTRIIN